MKVNGKLLLVENKQTLYFFNNSRIVMNYNHQLRIKNLKKTINPVLQKPSSGLNNTNIRKEKPKRY